jgi:hypothetical protein
MNTDHHLPVDVIEAAAEGQTTSEEQLHLAGCSACRARVARAAKLDRALYAMPSITPSPNLAPQIREAVAGAAAVRRVKQHAYTAGIAAGLTMLLALALVFQAGIELQVGGALNFFSFYIHQPEILINYPGDALAALVEVLPLAQMLATMAVVVIAIVLVQRFWVSMDLTPARGVSRRA